MSNHDELSKAEERLRQLQLQQGLANKENTKKAESIDALSIGIDLVSSIIAGLVIGYWLDKFFDSKPIFIIIFVIVGSLAAAKIIWQKLNIKNR